MIYYAWVDTCCIDKSSSAELSEAINSTFAWYKHCALCMVYLSDFRHKPPPDIREDDTFIQRLAMSRWFSRGWTLQELIAPRNVTFYDFEWSEIGSKMDMTHILSNITQVDQHVLRNSQALESIHVGKRMSWAARRETKRVEDVAYSLLGIFGVHMPLLYGEGNAAFLRLQQELARSQNDLTLFAWQAKSWSRSLTRGVFAESPSEFAHCAQFRTPRDQAAGETEFILTNRGLRFDRNLCQPLHSADTVGMPNRLILGLDCLEKSTRTLNKPRWVAVDLIRVGNNYVRHFSAELVYEVSRRWRSVPAGSFVAYIYPKLPSREPRHPLNVRYVVVVHLDDNLQSLTERLSLPHPGHIRLEHSELSVHFFDVNLAEMNARSVKARLVLVVSSPDRSLGAEDLFPCALYCEADLALLVGHPISNPQIFKHRRDTEDLMDHNEVTRIFYDYMFEHFSDETGRLRPEMLPTEVYIPVHGKDMFHRIWVESRRGAGNWHGSFLDPSSVGLDVKYRVVSNYRPNK